jgi:hypothetical protein
MLTKLRDKESKSEGKTAIKNNAIGYKKLSVHFSNFNDKNDLNSTNRQQW